MPSYGSIHWRSTIPKVSDTVLNSIERNTILLEDDVEYTANKQWDLKMPNIFVATFEIKGVGSSFNFRNTSVGTAANGYTLEFSGTTLTLKYGGAGITTATIPNLNATYGKVYITYEKQYFTVTVDGTRVLAYKDTGDRTFPEGEFINFFAGTGSPGFKNLKVVAGHLISDGTSNIAYVGGGKLDISGDLGVTSNTSILVGSDVVAEYTGPHDRPLRKYPEVAFLGDGDLSQFGYIASSSGQFGATYPASNAFTGTATTTENAWVSPMSTFETTQTNNGSVANSSKSFTGAPSGEQNGPWLKIELPNAIKLSHSKVYRWHASGYDTRLKDGYIYGSNDDSTYTRLVRLNNLGTSWDQYTGVTINVNATEHYKYYVLHVREIYQTSDTTAANSPYVTLGEWELYGHEEGSGSLDTTLKSVYNVPATTGTQLEVYYDAKDLADGALSTTSGAISGLGGTAVNGTAYGDPQVSNGAFVFDGTGDYISGTLPSSVTGEWGSLHEYVVSRLLIMRMQILYS